MLESKIEELALKYQCFGSTQVYKHQENLVDASFGWASQEKNIPITSLTRYNFALYNSLFIRISYLILVEKKLLLPKSTIGSYINNLGEASNILISDLFKGTTRLNDYLISKLEDKLECEYKDLDSISKRLNCEREVMNNISDCEYLEFIQNTPLSNEVLDIDVDCNYFLLRLLIESISKESFLSFIQNNIFTPLSITLDSHYNFDLIEYSSNFEDKKTRPLDIVDTMIPCVNFSIDQLAKFYDALFHYKIISKKTLQTLLPKKENFFGLELYYKSGFLVNDLISRKTICKVRYHEHFDLLVISISNFSGTQIAGPIINENYQSALTQALHEEFFKYNNPRLLPLRYNRRYIESALMVDVKNSQYAWVCSGSATIAHCYGHKNYHLFILVDNEIVVGLGILNWSTKTNHYGIDSVMIDKKFQNQGYGNFLIAQGVSFLQSKGAKRIAIGVNTQNAIAYKTYIHNGFKISSIEGNHYNLEWNA